MCCSACCSNARVPAFAADTCAAFRTGARLLPEFISRVTLRACGARVHKAPLLLRPLIQAASAAAAFWTTRLLLPQKFCCCRGECGWQVCEQLLTPRAGSDEGQACGYSLRLPWCCKSGAQRTRGAVRPTRPSAGSVYTLQLRGTAAPLACTAAHSAIHS